MIFVKKFTLALLVTNIVSERRLSTSTILVLIWKPRQVLGEFWSKVCWLYMALVGLSPTSNMESDLDVKTGTNLGTKLGCEPPVLDIYGRGPPLSTDEYGGCGWDLGLRGTNMASRHLLSYHHRPTDNFSRVGKHPCNIFQLCIILTFWWKHFKLKRFFGLHIKDDITVTWFGKIFNQDKRNPL